jgi:phosphoserine phosphatase
MFATHWRRYAAALCGLTLAILGGLHATSATQAQADPLPTWNDGPNKKAILDFVAAVTAKGGADFVPVADRIATFDNDGTLWCEKPLIQGAFMLERFKLLLPKNPAWKLEEPFKAILAKDREYLANAGEEELVKFYLATQANLSKDDFQANAAKFFATAKHPKFNVVYKELTYPPMVELIHFLQANGFQTFICSGGDVDFMRVVSREIYNIPVENVIGSSLVYDVRDQDGKLTLFRSAKLHFFNDKIDKPKGIWLHIGKRPIFAAGNVRSGGDIAMLRFTQSGKGRSLQLMVNHDDDVREFAYAEKDRASLNASETHGFHVVSMKNDWKKIFAFEK